MKGFLDFHLELDELRSAARTFDDEVGKAVSRDSQIGSYVQRLEERYDEAAVLTMTEMPKSEELVQELEEFLKNQQRREGAG